MAKSTKLFAFCINNVLKSIYTQQISSTKMVVYLFFGHDLASESTIKKADAILGGGGGA